ncbi:MAG TPA: patatin-like phospholipase family protein [Thermoguttaceae bacterium]|nr:patatin-like phospholipase family protein [Thermoguttaceae bacterium]HPP52143.1 patatin-like phospholipase family protein [Thermoguttaceae bacterium]
MARFRILSIDGGGVRGLIPAILLRRIVKTPQLEDFLNSVDLIAGTSTGGLLALGIAHGMDLEAIIDLYINKASEIFDDSWLDDLVDLGGLSGAEYDIKNLRKEVEKLFGNLTLGKLKKRVLITSFDLDNEDSDPRKRTWKPKLFHNFSGPNSDADVLVAKVALYTCAAPTYFPSVEGYIDGGVYANNPAMCALAQTQDKRYPPNPRLEEVLLLSLGTGLNLQYIKGKTHDWGYAQWIKPLINLMLDGVTGIADYQCRQLLNERYHRLTPVFPPGRKFEMDDVDKIDQMRQFAETYPIEETIRWITERWNGD